MIFNKNSSHCKRWMSVLLFCSRSKQHLGSADTVTRTMTSPNRYRQKR